MSDAQRSDEIPVGFCQCGCGQKTTIARYNVERDGRVAGQPVRFVNGHQARRPAEQRFREKYVVDEETGCWEWTAGTQGGYGSLASGSGHVKAHRFSYELHRGPIPAGLVIDHLCRNRRCVNPDHLEAVSSAENILRGVGAPAQNARKTHCKRGHEFTPENTYKKKGGRRACRRCAIEDSKRRYREKRGTP